MLIFSKKIKTKNNKNLKLYKNLKKKKANFHLKIGFLMIQNLVKFYWNCKNLIRVIEDLN